MEPFGVMECWSNGVMRTGGSGVPITRRPPYEHPALHHPTLMHRRLLLSLLLLLAVAAGAAAATKFGARPSLPTAGDLKRLFGVTA